MVQSGVIEGKREGVEVSAELARLLVLEGVKPFFLHQMDRNVSHSQLFVA